MKLFKIDTLQRRNVSYKYFDHSYRKVQNSFYLNSFYSGYTINECMKMINGNQKRGYNICMWNCRRGLVDENGFPSEKFDEMVNVFQSKQQHLFCLVESDLHSP